jgi:hypothetical protein
MSSCQPYRNANQLLESNREYKRGVCHARIEYEVEAEGVGASGEQARMRDMYVK